MSGRRRPSLVDGNHLLYHYLEKDLKEGDIWLFQMLATRLFTALGIWFSRTLFARLPVLIPFAIRDPTCRPRRNGDVDEWGSPTKAGLFRDDNSLVKNLPRNLRIQGRIHGLYNGNRLGNGFVAAHVWRALSDGSTLSSRDPDTNTFIPNLVWLPAQVAKLTDREGSFAQTYMQALSVKIYRNVELSPNLQKFVDRAWKKLPMPAGIPASGLPDPDQLSYFAETDDFVDRRTAAARATLAGLTAVMKRRNIIGKLHSSRYTKGLPSLRPRDIAELAGALRSYLAAVETSKQ